MGAGGITQDALSHLCFCALALPMPKAWDICSKPCKAPCHPLVSPRQFQIFSCYVLKGWSPERVKKELGVNAAQVYLAKHRVGRILKREAAKLAEEEQ